MSIFDLIEKLISAPVPTLVGILAVLALLIAFRALGIVSRTISNHTKETRP